MKRNKKSNKQQTDLNASSSNITTQSKEKKDPYLIADKKSHIPYLLARSTTPLPPAAPKPVLTIQQLREQQVANRKHNWRILFKFGVFSCLMLLAPVLTFYAYHHYASTHTPHVSFSDRATNAGILSSLSVFAVMIVYTIVAIREKID